MRHRPEVHRTPEKIIRTDMTWLRAALVFGTTMSKDPDQKVGACIVSPDNMKVSFGYNGFPMHVPDTKENWADKELKNAICQHAECNAVAKAPFDVSGATCYVTLKPCHRCLGILVNADIDRVIWLQNDDLPIDQHIWKYANMVAFELIRNSSGIECIAYRTTEVETQIARAILTGGTN